MLAGLLAAVVASRALIRRLRLTEATLRTERDFQRALLESLQEGIVACDSEGVLALFNRATREFHGLPEQPLRPEHWAEHFDIYDGDGLALMPTGEIPLYRAFQGETVRDAVMVVAPRQGTARTLLVNGQPIFDDAGRKLGAVVAMHDITVRRQMERELARLAAIVECSADAIFAMTLDGTIVNWNSGAERLYGYAAAEMIGRHASVLAAPDDQTLVAATICRLLRRESIEQLEVVRSHRDGLEFHAALTFSPIHDAIGEIIGLSCIARDITDRKKAEETVAEANAALIESKRFAEAVADHSTSIIFVFDLDSLSNVYSNHKVAEFLGYTADQVREVGENLLSVMLHPDDRARVLSHFADFQGMADGEVLEIEYRAQHASGEWRWVWNRETIFRRHPDGAPWQIMGTAQDITARKAAEEALRHNEATLRAVLESAPVIVYATDPEGVVTLSEGTGLVALGLKPGEAVGRSAFEFSGDQAENERNTRRALAGEAVTFDAHYSGLCLHTELRPLPGPRGKSGIIGVCLDVTERVASEQRFRVLFEQSSDAHILFDETGIIDCNPAAVAILGCASKAAILSLHPAAFSPEFQPDGRRSFEKCVEMDEIARREGCHRFEWTHQRVNGEQFPVEVTLTPVSLNDRPVMLVVWHDLTERKQAEQRLQEYAVVLEFQKNEMEKANRELEALATTDGLTGLCNHRAFQERLADEHLRACRYQTPLALLLLDVDLFKQFNDTFGHPAGDDVLRHVARILASCARETDIVARYGGEEFVVVLPQTDGDGALVIAERIRAALEGAFWDKRAITVSIGGCVHSLDAPSPAAMIERADQALYRSKAEGRNRVTLGTASTHAPSAPSSPPVLIA